MTAIKQRLEKLEAVAKIQAARNAVTEIWLVSLTREPDDSITCAARWRYPDSEFVALLDDELAEIGKLIETGQLEQRLTELEDRLKNEH